MIYFSYFFVKITEKKFQDSLSAAGAIQLLIPYLVLGVVVPLRSLNMNQIYGDES